MFNLVLFGPPGAGKGTQSAKIVEKYNFIHLSTGDMFRAHTSQGTPLGLEIKSIMDNGQLVPDEITIKMLEDELQKHPSASGFIYDGFPRTTAQAEALDRFLEQRSQTVDLVLQLEVTEEVIKNRIAERQKVSGRADDDSQKLLKRIDEYFDKTIHVLPYYQQQEKVKTVNGIGEIDSIFEAICETITY